MTENFFHVHTHSEFSVLDGMSSVKYLAGKAARHGQPALALTDHGNMSGTVQLYKTCNDAGILPLPGVEAYLLPDHGGNWDSKAKRFHLGIVALDFRGYQSLIKMVSKSYTRPQFSRFPRIDFDDLAILSSEARDHVAITTGCYFGLVQQKLVTEGTKAALDVVRTYAALFPHTYVELQNHKIDHGTNDVGHTWNDSSVCDSLYGIARQLGLPVVITQDTHYAEQKHKVAHALMKRMVYGGVDDEFPGDSFHLASTKWVRGHHKSEHWEEAQAGFANLLSQSKLKLPALDTYKAHIPDVVSNPQARIMIQCRKRLSYLQRTDKLRGKGNYNKRLTEELDVIEQLGLAGYFVLVRKIIRWCKDNDVFVEARGSANGSLVCFLLGITQVDPIQWGTIFERFISRDRTKPADIDLDVEDTARDRLIEYIRSHFQTEKVATFSKLGLDEEGRGSVFVTYLAHLRKKFGKEEFNHQRLGQRLKTLEDVKLIFPDDYEGLLHLAELEVRRSYGVHAAAILVSSREQAITTYVPTMLVASSNTTVTQFVGEDLDELGYCKVDILGQRTLATMRRTADLIGRPNPTSFEWIPYDDKPALRSLWEGRELTGVFHFEGYTKAKGARLMQPRTTMDLCLAQGLFMPGAMDSGQTDLYLKRRVSVAERKSVQYIHPAWEAALSQTYGTVIFQEQVIDIMRRLGMGIESINTFFKVVKDSGAGAVGRNEERLAQVRAEFVDLCMANGIQDIDLAWESTAGFVVYGFNRAHATGYGIRSYRCAYLKHYYPLEFMAALLENNVGRDNEPAYIREARRIGIAILPPDINISGAAWSIDRSNNAIRKGLSSVKGVGAKAANSIAESAPYVSLLDLIKRTNARVVTGGKTYLETQDTDDLIGALKLLKEAGAFQSIGIGRFE